MQQNNVPAAQYNKKRSFLLSGLPYFIMAHAAHHFLLALAQPLLPSIRSYFKIDSYLGASVIPMAYALASATGQLPAGWAADKFGPTLLIMIGTLGVAVAGILIGLSHSLVMFIICLVLMGLLAGGYHPAATPLISASVDPKIRGRALGFHLVGGNSAFFVAPLVAAVVIGIFGPDNGWRYSYLVLAVPTLVFGIIFYRFLTKHGGKTYVETAKRSAIVEKAPQPGYKRRLVAFLTMMVIGGGFTMSVIPLLTLYMTDKLGASDAVAGGLMSIVYSSGLWAGPVSGFIAEKIGSVKIIIFTGLCSGLIIFGFNHVSLGWSLYLLLFAQGLNNALRMPVTELFIMSQAPGKHRSKIFGVYYSTMQYTGAIFVLPGAFLIDKFGWEVMFNVAAIGVSSIALITAFFIFDGKDNYQGELVQSTEDEADLRKKVIK